MSDRSPNVVVVSAPSGAGKSTVLARVLQVVDVYDALVTARPYKGALSEVQARDTMIHEAKRGLWDFELVREFFHMLESERRAA